MSAAGGGRWPHVRTALCMLAGLPLLLLLGWPIAQLYSGRPSLPNRALLRSEVSAGWSQQINGSLLELQTQLAEAKRAADSSQQQAATKLQGLEQTLQALRTEVDSLRGQLGAAQQQQQQQGASAALLAAAAQTAAPSNSSGRAMVIIEPREDPRLQYVLENFDSHMPLSWDLYIFHGPSNASFVRAAAARVAPRRRVVYIPLSAADLSHRRAYNDLLKSAGEFWGRVDAEHVLVFQTDSVLCGASPRSISEFEHLGYIGCAYDERAGAGTHWRWPFWGVGGLSLRRKSAALACLATNPRSVHEDAVFSSCVDAGIGRRPESGHHLSEFCCQRSFLAKCFGAHLSVRDQPMNASQLPAFLAYCPEAVQLLELAPAEEEEDDKEGGAGRGAAAAAAAAAFKQAAAAARGGPAAAAQGVPAGGNGGAAAAATGGSGPPLPPTRRQLL